MDSNVYLFFILYIYFHRKPYPPKRSFNLSYTKLLNLSQMENNNDVVRTLSNSEYNFDALIHDFLREDLFILILKVLAKVCESDFKENKIKVLTAACNSNKFIEQFPIKISESVDRPNEEVQEFFHNVVIFFENAVAHLSFMCSKILPTMGATYYSMLGVNGAKVLGLDKDGCLQSFQTVINDVKVMNEESEKPQKTRSEMWKERQNQLHEFPAPNDFRTITIYPTPEEVLAGDRPFLRPNLVDKSYANVEHYLDVQFRLMREDYVRPLREGIAAINSNDRKKIKEVKNSRCSLLYLKLKVKV